MALLPRVNKVSLDRDRDRDRDPSSTRHVYRCLTRISGSVSKIMETLNWRSSSPWLLTVPVDHCHKEHPDNSWCQSSAGMFNKFWNEFYIIEFYFLMIMYNWPTFEQCNFFSDRNREKVDACVKPIIQSIQVQCSDRENMMMDSTIQSTGRAIAVMCGVTRKLIFWNWIKINYNMF